MPLAHLISRWAFAAIVFAFTAGFRRSRRLRREIKPILMTKCSSCHGQLKQKAGLRLDAGQFVHAGGKDGKVIEPGKAAASLLIAMVTEKDTDKRPCRRRGRRISPEQVG